MTEQQQQKQRAIDLLESRYRGMENVCEGITEALPDYVNRLNSIDTRLLPYVEDAISNI